MIPSMPRPPIELASRRLRVLRKAIDPTVQLVVAVTTRVPLEPNLHDCLQSVARQEMEGISVGVVLLLDGVGAEEYLKQVELPEPLRKCCWILCANCGTAARARNATLDFVEEHLPTVEWVARLDADDLLADEYSLSAAAKLGRQQGALAVLGGNRVSSRDGHFVRENRASSSLLERAVLLERLKLMADYSAVNELPSCNLLLRTGCAIRYPDIPSAEDHWLVADLLFHRPKQIAILTGPLFADYRLSGKASTSASESNEHSKSRQALDRAARTWARVAGAPGEVLGLGQEGIVRHHDSVVTKHFYPGSLSHEMVAWLKSALRPDGPAPLATFEHDPHTNSVIAQYPYEETRPFDTVDIDAVRDFLIRCLDHEVVCANVKRSNFRVRGDGRLVYIDVGVWIIPMNVSYFRDAAARLYSIGVLGAADEELQRRATDYSRPEVWDDLEGFSEFYGAIIERWIRRFWRAASLPDRSVMGPAEDVTLLLKACAMDARDIRRQVIHIVDQLAQPRAFAQRVLLVDPFRGPFLRQHTSGDLDAVLVEAERLQHEGWLDAIWIGPTDADTIATTNRRWFDADTGHTHAVDGVPVTPQVWAFDKIETRYVLQADLDVLVGRRDLGHDYLSEMCAAIVPEDVVCVAFNIPHEDGVRAYSAPRGEYKPEVRLGLLDLPRIRSLLPLSAKVIDGRLDTTWYRALHVAQQEHGLKTVRGGSSATFYVHPLNNRKTDAEALGRIRDLVAQGLVPESQLRRWDLEAPDDEWVYSSRSEGLVVVSLGRNTPVSKLRRYAQGLAGQTRQDFGVVVIDDASEQGSPSEFAQALSWLGSRLTLVRNPTFRGRVANYLLAVSEICNRPDTMILVVDLDDSLAHSEAVEDVVRLSEAGSDVVWAAPYRPDVPTRMYKPAPDRIRESYGGDVWIHLRAFRKTLFDQLVPDHFELDGEPLRDLVDYAMMIPMVKSSRSAVYLPRIRYWHERTTVLDSNGQRLRDRNIMQILAKNGFGR
jgi:hypothetical protein